MVLFWISTCNKTRQNLSTEVGDYATSGIGFVGIASTFVSFKKFGEYIDTCLKKAGVNIPAPFSKETKRYGEGLDNQ